MTKQSSVLSRSKNAENRVAHYFFGEDVYRDWKENHDLSGYDAEGNLWIGEVKNYAWSSGPAAFWALLDKAFEQAEGYSDKCFAVYIPKNSNVSSSVVMFRMNGIPVVVRADVFKRLLDGESIGET